MTLEAKSTSNLEIEDIAWNLNDSKDLGKIADELVDDIEKEKYTLQQTKQQVNALVQNCKKCKFILFCFFNCNFFLLICEI